MINAKARLTERAADLDRSGSIWIRLDEQPTNDASLTYGSQVFISKPDANSELHKVLEVDGCAQIRMLVKVALASQYAPTPSAAPGPSIPCAASTLDG
ncbi:hypothetical protein NX059_012454 [Plenodomus lindquistii]|nr:hypothetical protein NX059_012454 [Plenodomus lindquistii]